MKETGESLILVSVRPDPEGSDDVVEEDLANISAFDKVDVQIHALGFPKNGAALISHFLACASDNADAEDDLTISPLADLLEVSMEHRVETLEEFVGELAQDMAILKKGFRRNKKNLIRILRIVEQIREPDSAEA